MRKTVNTAVTVALEMFNRYHEANTRNGRMTPEAKARADDVIVPLFTAHLYADEGPETDAGMEEAKLQLAKYEGRLKP